MVDRRIVLTLMAVALAGAGLMADASPRAHPVEAAFPGTNGKIAFVSNRYGSTPTFSNSDIFTMYSDGSGVTRVVPDLPSRGFVTLEGNPTWSPDGRRIAFTSDYATGGSTFVMNPDGTGTFFAGQIYSSDPAWSPDGHHLVVSADYFGFEHPLGSTDLFVVDLDVREGVNLTQSEIKERQPAWSPDGRTIAFVVSSPDNTSSNVYTVDAGGQSLTNLTNVNDSYNAEPDWSPDGTKIAFISNREGNFEIYVMDADGSNVTRLTTRAGGDGDPVWSPDGQHIAFAVGPYGSEDVYVMNADGSNQRNITNNPARDLDPSWQPVIAGNANCQGGIDAIDAAIILQFGASLIDTLACQDQADVNGDGSIDSRDAALILQYAAGLLHSLPP